MTGPRRTLTTWAVGVLWLDGLLLGYAGIAQQRPLLVAGAVACGLASWGVVAAWRRHQRAVAEVAAARRELAREAEAIQALLRAPPSPH